MINIDVLTDDVSLYFHIPFCTKKCDYCHFYVLPDKLPLKAAFMQCLKQEWEAQLPLLLGRKVASIYFGGGTPYLLGPPALNEILLWIKSSLSFAEEEIEITLEANPENVTFESMCAYRQAGINRISIGVQSLDNTLLHTLGRQHTASKSITAVEIASKAGIYNISIDLMYDLPSQTLKSWRESLHQIKKLPISHLSLYNLTIEPHTVFFKYLDTLKPLLPDEETSLNMYKTAVSEFQEAGFQQYEISAFCKEGQFAKHNIGYWTGREFIGYGPSAFSYWKKRRFRNIANLSKYASKLQKGLSPVDFDEILNPDAHLRELLTIGLRILQGIDLDKLQRTQRFDTDTLKTIDSLIRRDYLEIDGSSLRLTHKGIIFYDSVATELI